MLDASVEAEHAERQRDGLSALQLRWRKGFRIDEQRKTQLASVPLLTTAREQRFLIVARGHLRIQGKCGSGVLGHPSDRDIVLRS